MAAVTAAHRHPTTHPTRPRWLGPRTAAPRTRRAQRRLTSQPSCAVHSAGRKTGARSTGHKTARVSGHGLGCCARRTGRCSCGFWAGARTLTSGFKWVPAGSAAAPGLGSVDSSPLPQSRTRPASMVRAAPSAASRAAPSATSRARSAPAAVPRRESSPLELLLWLQAARVRGSAAKEESLRMRRRRSRLTTARSVRWREIW